MKRLIYSTEDIFGFSDVRGRKIKVEQSIPFSFYYSCRNSSHGPRVKVVFDAQKIKLAKAGVLKLVSDWEFTPSPEGPRVSAKMVDEARVFFRKYLVMLLLIWDGHLEDEAAFRDYLEGDIDLQEFISQLDFYFDYADSLNEISSVSELEEFCRNNNLCNFYGN